MFCVQCGQALPEDAHFCSKCGHEVAGETRDATDSTTAAIDLSLLEPDMAFGDVPDLAPGTGMFIVVRGPNAGARFLLDRDVTTIGRHPDSDIFLDDVTVSRRHAEVRRSENSMELVDLGSLNGSYVNGERVDARVLLSTEEAQIGRFKLIFVGPTVA